MFVLTEEHHENPVLPLSARPREKSFVPLHHLGQITVIKGFQGKNQLLS